MKKTLLPFAWIIAKIINHNSKLLSFYRDVNFKGKLFISRFINIPHENGVYSCQELKYHINFSDQIQEMVYLGTYEKQELQFLKNYVQKDWICLDVGANIGFYTLNLSKLVGENGKVYALEPSPKNFRELEKNIELNALDNCVACNIALSSDRGDFVFSVSPDRNSGWGRLGKWRSAQSEIIVKVDTLDQFVEEQNISIVDFLKIDIEGHELEFLKGAEKCLRSRLIDRIMIEYCGCILEPKGIDLKQYIDIISKFGYSCKYFNLRKVEEANRGKYRCKGETLNLFFKKKNC